MRRVLDKGLPGDGKREHQGVECKDIEQRIKPVLVQHHEADEDEATGQRMRDVEGEAVHLHQKLLDTNSSSVPSRPSMSAAPRNCGTRKTRIFAVAVSNSARWRPEYSSTIASCTMVSSRCVAGLSTGIRPFSASATMTSATIAIPSETRNPT